MSDKDFFVFQMMYKQDKQNCCRKQSSASRNFTLCTSRNNSRSNSSQECRGSSRNYPALLSILAWSMTLLLVSSCIGIADAGVLMGHPFSKRSFIDIQCKGVYDKSLFARLDRICEDCYNLFREPQLHTLCRWISKISQTQFNPFKLSKF